MCSPVSTHAVPASEGLRSAQWQEAVTDYTLPEVICVQLFYIPFMWHQSSLLIPVTESH